MLSIIGFIAGVITFIGGIGMAFVRYRETKSGAASVNWPSAPGEITSITVRKFGFIRPAYAPFVEYTFKANGEERTGRRISYRVIASRAEDEIQQVAAKYPVGKKVKVTYNPANPADSSLEPGPEGTKIFTNDVIWFLCIGAFCILSDLFLP